MKARAAQVGKIDRDRAGPAEAEKKEGDGADRVEMSERVEAQSPQPFSGWVPHLVSYPAMGHFMEDHGKEKWDGHKNKS